MAKPKPVPDRKANAGLFFRDEAICAGLDAWAKQLNDANPYGSPWHRTSLARATLRRALDERAAKKELP